MSYPSKATGWGASYGGLTTVADYSDESYSDEWTWTTANNQVTITGYTGTGGMVVIPASIGGVPVTAIGENAFKDSIGLTSLTIPSSVISIGSNAFNSCTGLTSLAIPNSVTSVGAGAFAFCTGLTSLTIGESVTNIMDYAFAFCSGLTRVMIRAATVLGIDAFPSTTTVFRYLTEAQLTSRDNQQNAAGQATGQAAGQAAGRALGQADVKNAPGTFGLYTAAQYAANYSSGQAAGQTAGRVLGQADVTNAPNTHGLYNLSQVQALNVDAPLLTREAVSNKFKLTIKVKKSTDLKTFSAFPFVFENSTINANGEMEFQFTSTENASFYRLEAR